MNARRQPARNTPVRPDSPERPERPLPAPLRWPIRLGVGLVLAAAGILAHGHALRAPFVFDDVHAIVENPQIRGLTPFARHFAAPPESALSGRPFASASFALTYAWAGLDPFAYHATNLLLLVLIAVVLADLGRRCLEIAGLPPGRAFGLASAAALLWVVHPLNSEVVHYAIQRTELLWSLCGVLALDLSLSSRRGPPWRRRALVAATTGLLVLAMAGKETAVVLPVLLVLLDVVLPDGDDRRSWLRRRRPAHAAFAATWLVLAALMISTPRGASVGFTHGVSAAHYLANQAVEIANYARLVVWPAPLLIDYGVPWPWQTDWARVLACGIVVLSAFLAAIGLLWRRPALGALALAPFILLAPTSSIVPIATEVAAERRMLLPLAAIALLVVLAVDAARRRCALPLPLLLVALATATAALSWRSAARAEQYDRPAELWRIAADARPGNGRAQSNLAHALQEAGDISGAVAHYRRAVELAPESALAHANLGAALSRAGDMAEAIPMLTRAHELSTDDPRASFNLGVAYETLGRRAEAERAYRGALERDRAFAPALLNLAGLLTSSRPDEALDLFVAAADAAPEQPNGYGGAAWLLATHPDPARRDPARAVAMARRAVELGGAAALWLETLAVAQRTAGLREADATLDAALRAAEREDNPAAQARLRRLQSEWNR